MSSTNDSAQALFNFLMQKKNVSILTITRCVYSLH